MNWKKLIWIIVGVALVVMGAFKLLNNKKISESKVYQYDKEKAVSVQVDTIQWKSIIDEKNYTGTFEPNQETKVSAEIQGKINSIFVDVGSSVSKGQALIQLDNSLLKLQLKAIEVQIGGLEADVKRYSILTEADAIQGIQLEKAQLGLESAKAQRATLKEQINKSTIKSPFNGIVTAKLNEIGGFAAPGIPLLQITNIGELKLTILVSENELKNFQLGQQYAVSVDAYPELSLFGKVILIGSKSNPGNSFPIQLSVSNTKRLEIKSGMFGKVRVKGNEKQGIAIASSAVIGSSGQPQVYLIKNGKAVLQNIVISAEIQNTVVVSSGLEPGDIIITSGFINLFDGSNVVVI